MPSGIFSFGYKKNEQGPLSNFFFPIKLRFSYVQKGSVIMQYSSLVKDFLLIKPTYFSKISTK